jgi:hypothetical protein
VGVAVTTISCVTMRVTSTVAGGNVGGEAEDVGCGVGTGVVQLISAAPAIRKTKIMAVKSQPLRNLIACFGFTFAVTFRLRSPDSQNLCRSCGGIGVSRTLDRRFACEGEQSSRRV